MRPEVNLHQDARLYDRGIEGHDHAFRPGIQGRLRSKEPLIDLSDAAQRLKHALRAPVAAAAKADLIHCHLLRTGLVRS